MVFRSSNLDPRRYNEPTANEVAVVYVGEEGDVPAEHSLAVHLRTGGLQNIQVIDPRLDCYVRIEQNRLNYDRTHQRELRVETYRGLTDYVAGDMDVEGPPGARRIILPSSFPGSPRAMMQSYQDAMAIVSNMENRTYS
ncbi:hypothetical protein TELCIR_18411 [Teladorsagia circumcincta]|uniref:Helitron helicase-like domain-containing protein n=1 Tax=Teladorsagia circumcincta TaxID=45464 RepID=A0A2G9TS42_TELCI|nr:hypothetical protein TELCIR_18411 [Teladorsagia circumcincta]